ncbi:hypothetical protein BU26DRAFT_582791 [Trematosphaeria pertusa]|uniref:Uncharacterized protein n=1 Tax=Trematosphaeria pertusa TaxID=390896 RepID=A0A6A6IV54_9PLEO|nr:uncharacterized protein BU26DRAFT_582791 [Trematosphaeria pertusa]KAF2254309.1 hypothetical protein BU26DRAFT_582791 [Trematosphaeria pertusa]
MRSWDATRKRSKAGPAVGTQESRKRTKPTEGTRKGSQTIHEKANSEENTNEERHKFSKRDSGARSERKTGARPPKEFDVREIRTKPSTKETVQRYGCQEDGKKGM